MAERRRDHDRLLHDAQEPPRNVESRRALRALKRHLRATYPFAKFYIRQLPLSAPGWTLFAGENQDVRHGRVHYWVVRADGSVVTEDPRAELSRAYRSLEAVRPAPLASPEDLAWLAVALLLENRRLLDQRRYQQLSGLFEGDALAPPQLVRQGDGATLVFWVSVGHGLHMDRYELQISADYEVTISMTSPQLRQHTR